MINLILQAAPSTGSAGSIWSFAPFIVIMVIFYFLLIRPQNQRLKKHKEMLTQLQRGDTVVTGGGLIGKVIKVSDDELTIDLGNGTKVKAVRSMVANVRGHPAPANDSSKGVKKLKNATTAKNTKK